MDLTTLGALLVFGFGLIGADAALNANTFGVQINVPPEIESHGISRQVAEDVFTAEIVRNAQTPSLLAAPAVRSSSEQTIVSALSKLIHLDDMTYAVQKMLGLNPVRLSGALMPNQPKPRFFLTGSSQASGAFSIDIRSEDGDYIELIRRGAQLTLERVGPYRAALYHFVNAAEAKEDFSRAETIALRELAIPARADTIEGRVYLQNLLGMIALMRNDVPAAERHFREVIERAPHNAIGYLNLAFVQVHKDEYADAIWSVRRILEPQPLTKVPQLLTAAETTWGVSAWGLGDLDQAERMFDRAAKDYWGTTAAYEYWGKLLEERGRKSEAETKRRMAVANLPFFENYPEVAMLYFNLTPKNRDPLTRR